MHYSLNILLLKNSYFVAERIDEFFFVTRDLWNYYPAHAEFLDVESDEPD